MFQILVLLFTIKLYASSNIFKNIFAKGYISNWSEEVFVVNEVKNTVPWIYVINDLKGEEVIGTFYE